MAGCVNVSQGFFHWSGILPSPEGGPEAGKILRFFLWLGGGFDERDENAVRPLYRGSL